MALDGAFLKYVAAEMEEKLVGLRVEKIFQPNRDEIVIAFRGASGSYKVLTSARANSPRVSAGKSSDAANAVYALAKTADGRAADGDKTARA